MKNIQQRKKSQTDAIDDSDDTDAKVINYQNFKDSPGNSEEEESLEFVNPLFKKQSRLFNSTLDNLDDTEETTEKQPDYDKLAFNNRNTNSGPPSVSPKPKSKLTPEEIEMGVKNYGYMDEKPRPDSWDSSLSAFNPYAVDTPIRQPVTDNRRSPSVGIEMAESPPRDNRMSSMSKQSDYSSISDVNPYLTADKGPQYEDLAGIRSGHRNGRRPEAGPPVPHGHKKTNMLYEPAVITQKTAISKRVSVDEDRGYEEHSSYCHLIFTILVGILAIIALLLVFLLVFGVVSAKKCKECDITNPSTGASTGGGGVTGISQEDLDLQLVYIKGNLSLLQTVLHQNSSITIATLQEELDQQRVLVSALTLELNQQKVQTNALNVQTQALQHRLDRTTNKLDKVNESITVKTDKLNIRITTSEISAGQKITDVEKAIVNSQAIIFDSMNNNTKRLENTIDQKANKTNLTTLKIDVEESNKKLTKMIIASTIKSNKLNTSLHNFVSQVNTTLRQELIDLNKYVGRIQNNVSIAFNGIQNISLIEGPPGPRGFNGSKGANGSSTSGIKSCKYNRDKVQITNANVKSELKAHTPHGTMNQIISASCSGTATYFELVQDKLYQRYYCRCTGVNTSGERLVCAIHFWICSG